jgi:PAS domain S-box-containing protein
MTLFLWIAITGLLAAAGWGWHLVRLQHRKIRKLKRSLLEANQKTHQQQEAHAERLAHWEQTEEKLSGFLQLMDTLLNTIPNPIYYKDAKGRYQGCNKVFTRQVLGLTRDRIIGKRPQELTDAIPAELAAVYQREEHIMLEKAGFHTFEAPVQCADGQRREFLFSLAPVMDRDGQVDGSVAVLSDLTEKNRAAQHRTQKEKLEGVLETAGAVCHEFNQPLQAISGYTELMAMKLDGHDARPYIDKLTAQIERMREITDQLQRVTRYETKDYAGYTKIIDLNKASKPQKTIG